MGISRLFGERDKAIGVGSGTGRKGVEASEVERGRGGRGIVRIIVLVYNERRMTVRC